MATIWIPIPVAFIGGRCSRPATPVDRDDGAHAQRLGKRLHYLLRWGCGGDPADMAEQGWHPGISMASVPLVCLFIRPARFDYHRGLQSYGIAYWDGHGDDPIRGWGFDLRAGSGNKPQICLLSTSDKLNLVKLTMPLASVLWNHTENRDHQ